MSTFVKRRISNIGIVCLLHVQVELDCFDKYEGGYSNDNI